MKQPGHIKGHQNRKLCRKVMATKTLYYTNANGIVQIGKINWDDGDNCNVYTYGGNDPITFFVDSACEHLCRVR